MMALVALFATSCEQAGDEKGGNGGSTSLFDVKIEVDGNVADITVWPANYDMYYAWDVFAKADIDTEFGGDIDALAQFYLEYIEYFASQYGVALAEVLYQGKDSYSYSLDSNTEYVFVAFGVDVDKVKVNTAVETKTFVTGEAAPVNMTATECYVDYYPATESVPFGRYYLEMWNAEQTEIAQLLVLTEPTAANCAGTYVAAGQTLEAGIFIPGSMEGNYIYPSMWGEVDNQGYLTKYAFMVDGTIEVAINGANYTIDADLTDENGVAFTFDYSGEAQYTDNSASAAKASKANFRQLSIAARMHRAGKISIRK